MAERLDSYNFQGDNPGRRREYPWTEWEDGAAWQITQGVDFDIALKSMQSQLYLRAALIGSTMQTQFQDDGISIVFQFGPPDPVKAEAERRRRAAKRAEHARRQAAEAGQRQDGNGSPQSSPN